MATSTRTLLLVPLLAALLGCPTGAIDTGAVPAEAARMRWNLEDDTGLDEDEEWAGGGPGVGIEDGHDPSPHPSFVVARDHPRLWRP